MAFSNAGVNVTINATNAQAGAQQYAQACAVMTAAIAPLGAGINQLNAQMTQLIGVMQRTGNQARQTANTFAAFTAASVARDAIIALRDSLYELIVGSTLYAARTEELGVALNAVAKATGTSIQVIKQQELAMKQLNITTQDARQSLSRFLQAGLDITKSGVLARTAQDLAVIAGVSTSEEINKLIIGIQTLQSRNLRTAGVFITVDEVLDRLSKTTHRARDSFSTFEKQQATLNAVLEFGTRVTGTYEAAMTTASKQMRSLERVVFEAQNSIGSLFVPTMLTVITSLTTLFELVTKYPRTFLLLTTAVLALATAFAILNTAALPRLAAGLISVLQGVQAMYRSILLLPAAFAQVAAAGTDLALVMASVQVSIGGILGITAIIAVLGVLAYTLYNAASATKEFIKISDNSITVGSQEIDSLKARVEAMDEYKRSIQDINKASGAIKLLGDDNTGYESIGTNLEKSRSEVVSITADLSALANRKNTLVKELDVVYQRAVQVEVDRSYVDKNRIFDELKSIRESTEIKESDLNKARDNVDKYGQAFIKVKDQLTQSADAAGMNVREVAKLRDEHAREIDNLKMMNPELSKQYSLLKGIADAHDHMAQAIRNTIVAEEEKLKSTARDVILNLELAKANAAVLEINRTAAVEEQRAAQGRGNSLTAIEQKVRIGVASDPFNPLSYLAKSGISKVQADANEEFTKSETAITENSAAFDLYASSLDSVKQAFEKLHPEFKNNNEALYTYLGGQEKLNLTLPKFIELQGFAAQAVSRTAEATRKAALGIQDLDDAIKNLRVAAYDEVGPGGRLLNLGVALKGQAEQELKRQQRIGNIGQTVTELPVKLVPQLVRRTEASKQFTEIVRKEYGGNFESAMKEIFEDPLLKEKLGWQGTPEAFKAFMDPIIKEQERAAKAAKDADNVVKTEAEKLRETLRRTKDDINSFLNTGTAEFKLRMDVEDAERVKKDLEAIMNLRHRMGVPLNVPIKLEDVQKTRHELEILAKVFDDIRNAQNDLREAQLKAGAPVVDAEVRAQTELLKLVRTRREEEQQIAAEIAIAINKRIQLETDAADLQAIQARAFLDNLNAEQKGNEDLITALTKNQIAKGDFSFADNNKLIAEGMKVANDPVVAGLNDTQKTIEKSAAEIKQSQVDFGMALGAPVSHIRETLDRALNNHAEIQLESKDILREIATNTSQMANNYVDAGAGYSSSSGVLSGYPTVDAGPGTSTSARLGQPTPRRNAVLSPVEVANTLRRAGFPASALQTMTAITLAESGGVQGTNRFASNEKGSDMSYGIGQINLKGTNRPYTKEQLFDPDFNARIMYKLFQSRGGEATMGGNFFDWGAGPAHDNRFRQYMGVAGQAVRGMGGAFGYTQNKTTEPVDPAVARDIAAAEAMRAKSELRAEFMNPNGAFKGLPVAKTLANAYKYTEDPASVKAGTTYITEQTQRLDDINYQRELNELRNNGIKDIISEKKELANLARGETLYNRTIKVAVDNVKELSDAQDDLNRLRTNAIDISEVLQGTELDRLRSEQDAQRESIRLANEQRLHNDPVRYQGELSRLLQEENNRRWQSDLELENRESLLRDREARGFTTSVENKARIEKEASVTRREEREQLQERLIQLDDQLLHHGENAALEYAVAWREALKAVQDREDEAVKRALKATAEIADQNTISVQRIRATVLENINQTQGMSESIGGLFNDTFKVYTDDIDRWIDKTTESMGNLGKIFNNFFKQAAHRAIGGVQNAILDAIFPETEAERQAKAPQTYGKDGSDAIFRGAQQTIADLGLTSAASANQIAVGTGAVENSMVRVAYASEAAASALMRLAAVGGTGGGTVPGLGDVGSLIPLLGGGSSGSSSGVSSIFRGIGGIGLGSGTLTNGSTASRAAIGNIFSRGLGGGFGSNARNPFANLNIGGFAGGTLNTLSGNLGSTPQGTLSTLSGLVSGVGGTVGGRTGGILSGISSLFSKGGLSSLLGSIGPQAPILGLGLGVGLGGDSGIGKLLGGIGGGLAGLGILGGLSAATLGGIGGSFGATIATGLGGIFGTTSGLGGAFAGLFGGAGSAASFAAIAGPLALIAAPLIIGAIIFAKNKARQQAEKQRQTMSTDINARLTEILNDVKADKIDGSQASAQAKQAFDDYRTNMATIKDSKTRRIAEQYITSRDHPPMLLMDQINAAISAQKLRKEIEAKQIPTYAQGGVTQSNVIRVSRGERLDYGSSSMRIPGQFDGRDDILAFVPRGTRITPPYIMPVHAYAGGGTAGIAPAARASSLTSSGPAINVTAVIVMNEAEAKAFMDKVPNAQVARKVAADAPINPQVLPAALAQSLGISF